MTDTGFGILGVLMLLVVAVIGMALFAFWVWMLVHAITNKGLSDTEKVIWVLVVLFAHFLGAVLYFFIGRRKAA